MEKIIYKTDNLNPLTGCTLTYGHFSTIHPGHIRYLKHAKNKGKKLVVALLGDSNSAPKRYQFNQNDRAKSLEMFPIVDNIICLKKNEIKEIVSKLKPSFLILGTEYKNSSNKQVNEAIKLQKESNRVVEFHAGEINYASTDLFNNSEFDLSYKRKVEFLSACKKQSLTKEKLLDAIKVWNNQRILVIGDTIVDQYSACEPLGISAEAPVVVVKELENKSYIGGAAIVASHIRALGSQCDFISIIGNDENGVYTKNTLNKNNINEGLIIDNSRPTTFKKRYLVENQKLFRVSKLDDSQISEDIENQLIENIENLAPKSNCIVISDFVYGVITEKILMRIKEISREYRIPLIGDIQCSSQVGSLMKFNDFALLCPNEKEARIALRDNHSGIEKISNDIISSLNAEGLIMKLGPNGFISYDCSDKQNIIRQAFPALTVNPLDVAGAGDSIMAVMANGLASNHRMMTTSALACCMASISVSNMGNIPIKSSELINFLNTFF
tara:strand:+ start:1266 stop:2759 length:1494 start_codon:yes stop_codon:yes gene_type:complete